MKVVIFAGGLGTRLSEETGTRPKPMVELGGKPIIWHIMKIYSYYGFNDFVVCLGYKGYMLKEYFSNYFLHNADLTVDMANNSIEYHNNNSENFRVTLVDTGAETKTAGRLQQVQKYLNDEEFMLTYGDGLGNVNISDLLDFHKTHGKIATVTSIQMDSRFGGMDLDAKGNVTSFKEKAKDESKWINGGFFVLKPEVFNYLKGDMSNVMWEDTPLEGLAADGQLAAYRHKGFWKPMDALRDKLELEHLWQTGQAKWKVW